MKTFARSGWRYESARHSMAAKGVKTKYFSEKRFQLGQRVWYKGRVMEVADHQNGRCLVWSPDPGHKSQPEEWIPENNLANAEKDDQ